MQYYCDNVRIIFYMCCKFTLSWLFFDCTTRLLTLVSRFIKKKLQRERESERERERERERARESSNFEIHANKREVTAVSYLRGNTPPIMFRLEQGGVFFITMFALKYMPPTIVVVYRHMNFQLRKGRGRQALPLLVQNLSFYARKMNRGRQHGRFWSHQTSMVFRAHGFESVGGVTHAPMRGCGPIM